MTKPKPPDKIAVIYDGHHDKPVGVFIAVEEIGQMLQDGMTLTMSPVRTTDPEGNVRLLGVSVIHDPAYPVIDVSVAEEKK